MPRKTGYAKLLSAAKSLVDVASMSDVDDLSDAAAAEYFTANSAALNSARDALGGDCSVEVEFTEAFYERYVSACCDLLSLAMSFCLAVRYAERRDDLDQATQHATTALSLADALRRGGLATGTLVANTIVGSVVERLRRIHRRLGATAARQLARELVRIDVAREPFDVIMVRDERWEKAVGMVGAPPDFLTMKWPEEIRDQIDADDEEFIRQSMQRIADLPGHERRELNRCLDDRELALLRLLAIETAVVAHFRCYEKHPDSLGELVPDCLSALPVDPFTEASFSYVAADGDCVVYSPGPTGIDHGGRFGCWQDVVAGEADLCLALHDYACGAGERDSD